MGVEIINEIADPTHQWIVQTVRQASEKPASACLTLAFMRASPNAFRHRCVRPNSALVAVSTDGAKHMNREEVEADRGNEIAHVTNGDIRLP